MAADDSGTQSQPTVHPASETVVPGTTADSEKSTVTPDVGNILERVAQVDPTKKADTGGKDPLVEAYETGGFNSADIEKIPDPTARQHIENMAKSLHAGYMRKFQSVENTKQELEAKSNGMSQWTPERIQQALNDPTFLQAAKQTLASRVSSGTSTADGATIPSGFSEEEWSYLSDGEKRQTLAHEQQRQQVTQAMNMLSNEVTSLRTQGEDAQLRTRYANYNPSSVNTIQRQLVSGELRATREHLHKVIDYDDAVRRAYSLGREDERGGIKEKVSASTSGGMTVEAATEIPVRGKSESGVEYFKRLALNRLKQARSK